jgi:hypothetical protein
VILIEAVPPVGEVTFKLSGYVPLALGKAIRAAALKVKSKVQVPPTISVLPLQLSTGIEYAPCPLAFGTATAAIGAAVPSPTFLMVKVYDWLEVRVP